jgi:hypothetical protein
MVEDSYICYSTSYNFQKIIPAFFSLLPFSLPENIPEEIIIWNIF